jgi:hypothetical protein
MKLKDTMIRNIKASDKPVKLLDGGGLYFKFHRKEVNGGDSVVSQTC